jgi:hypothetical protein
VATVVNNVQIAPMQGGALIGTDDIAGTHYQRIKVGYGPEGTYADVSDTNPLPATILVAHTCGSYGIVVGTAGLRVQLDDQPAFSATIRARTDNVGLAYVGGPDVTGGNGMELQPGEAVNVEIANTNALYVDVEVSGDAVRVLWVGP